MSGPVHTATVTGGCLCGAVRFEVEVKAAEDGAVIVDVCHCGMCRRWHGGPALAVQATGPLRFENEEPLGLYRSSAWAERGFCKTCGSSLFWRMEDGSFATLAAGALDDPSRLRLDVEIYVDEQPDFYAFEGARTRLTGAEVVALFQQKS